VISPMTVIKVSRRIAQNTLCARCRSPRIDLRFLEPRNGRTWSMSSLHIPKSCLRASSRTPLSNVISRSPQRSRTETQGQLELTPPSIGYVVNGPAGMPTAIVAGLSPSRHFSRHPRATTFPARGIRRGLVDRGRYGRHDFRETANPAKCLKNPFTAEIQLL